jgi:hypothetical protein
VTKEEENDIIGGIAKEVDQRKATHYGFVDAKAASDFEPHVALGTTVVFQHDLDGQVLEPRTP